MELLPCGQEHEPRRVGEFRKYAGGLREHLFDLSGLRGGAEAHGLLLLAREGMRIHQVVDEDAVAQVGGEPAGGDVGLGEKARIGKVAHDVADGGGAQGDVRVLRERAAPHGFARIHENVDDGAQDFPVSLAKFQGVHLKNLPVGRLPRWILVWHSGAWSANLFKIWGDFPRVKRSAPGPCSGFQSRKRKTPRSGAGVGR